MFEDYHAVSIHHGSRCCQSVAALDGKRFLSTEAPALPLTDCSAPGACRCRYHHHTDRREDFRRDTDVGLPERGWFGINRRLLSGRRANDAA